MTLNCNKNEPAVTLERVNSARTALSDLYLEQLLQPKPKSEKVRGFREVIDSFFHFRGWRVTVVHISAFIAAWLLYISGFISVRRYLIAVVVGVHGEGWRCSGLFWCSPV